MSLRQEIRCWSCNVVYERRTCPQEAWRRARPVRISSQGRMLWCWGRATSSSFDSRANPSDEAPLDVSARGFCQRGQRAFFDVRVFNPFAKRHLNQKLNTAFSSNENEKRRHYNQRVIEVEHGSFSPLVFSPYGGNGREAERFLTELVQTKSHKKQMDYSTVIHWLRATLCFNLLRPAVYV